MTEKLRSGYTTGTHATATLIACLYEYVYDEELECLKIILPQDKEALIEVNRVSSSSYFSIKGDNDDIDVTKGAKISCELMKIVPTHLKEQEPSLVKVGNSKLYIYGGAGVGIVTKKGLKIAPTHPAINPTPLQMMQENSYELLKEKNLTFYVVISVNDGEKIARDTANSKVGVIGGISILGTRGIVKPVSASAYIDSVETEIDVAAEETLEYIVFTLGNTAHDVAKELYDEVSIIEIGNFVYDASQRLKKHHFKKVIFITSVAKMCKVAQGFKNTHNKFGTIDFDEVRVWLDKELDFELEDEEFLTLKAVLQSLKEEQVSPFVKLLGYKSTRMFQKWFKELNLDVNALEIITLNGKKREMEELKW